MAPSDAEFYFCLKHRTVEPRKGCRAADRLGPYPTEAEAARALEKVAERNEAWAAQDADDPDADPAADPDGQA